MPQPPGAARPPKRILSVGECMVEMSHAGDGLWRQGFAGDTLNTAWYLRALLPEDWAVDYFTVLGTDPLSEAMVRFMRDAGIGTGCIPRHPDRVAGLYMISLKDGERSFTYWRDRSAARTLADDTTQLQAAVEGADLLYVSGITMAILNDDGRTTLLDRMAKSRAEGTRVAFDPNLRPKLWKDAASMCRVIEEAAARADIVLPSHDDEAAHFGDASLGETARRYAALGAGEVLVKNGGGAMALSLAGAAPVILPAPGMVTPLDTTGAGDSFNAGYLAARLTGCDPHQAMLRGHALAARVVRHFGALMPHDRLDTLR
ncbi:2-keto-3-deoxygluconate kinase [Paracoccus pantotrophus]|uniref:2-keto-3-deoxygluconate kinase n=1 Tax=Paracoccus pantotrophus TaxID=82367 RepID=A0AAE6NYH6_PARPN|nr:sugar kinase [Paracoccus pantotrophus]QFG37338.1 sugar kinase [Paracoccus pantotrophus]RKS52224.1 2-keto-3-deoxygluconate kinase [Paracoccus pantotrophus]